MRLEKEDGEHHWLTSFKEYFSCRKCDVLNRGFSGYNTSWGKHLIRKIVPEHIVSDVVAVTIFFGANDAVLKGQSQKHVPLDDFRQNLKEIVDYLTEIGLPKEKLILITPPPLDEKAWSKHCRVKDVSKLNRRSAVTQEYSNACCSVAKQCDVACIDLASMQEEPNWERFLEDGLHLSIEGSYFLEEKLNALMLEKTKDLPVIFPDWKDIDTDRPEDSLFE
ncbi:isoamyl acetate-hydrolyzing esterase 1 homolog isoform X2 [Anneissia japonica]|uniref:isoamyl acetate-hydrolyzing esterase 1 homolog isoform X2 n=1 Tax=Anneissia japonica TaxID=1529436 RepID=UPI0014255F0A|nr:isoamyl acetate-hydrolyzing esterase 1 homolog isoform X2 [Anneissia japonica]